MERLGQLIAQIPEFCARGFLDESGGNLSVRTPRGIYVSPYRAGAELHWRLEEDDFVLFPGEGDASMAKAGRRPSRENRVPRAVLNARPDWNFVYHGHPQGLLSFALAGQPLPVTQHHSDLIRAGKPLTIPVTPAIPPGLPELSEQVTQLVREHFADCEHGAVLLGGNGPLVAGVDVASTFAVLVTLEDLARAQLWRLTPRSAE